MAFSPLSFLLGLAAASLVPVLSRVMRPLAVEATAAGMGALEDARRMVAEQVETLEDILAEARARREHLDAEATAAAAEEMAADESEPEAEPEPSRRSSRDGLAGAPTARSVVAPPEA
jgi:hypothetical protein